MSAGRRRPPCWKGAPFSDYQVLPSSTGSIEGKAGVEGMHTRCCCGDRYGGSDTAASAVISAADRQRIQLRRKFRSSGRRKDDRFFRNSALASLAWLQYDSNSTHVYVRRSDAII